MTGSALLAVVFLTTAGAATGPAPAAPAAPTATADPFAGLSPRAAYNAALRALETGDLERAERGFTLARDQAGIDHELRYRAAFNLGMAHAARADRLAGEKPLEAIAALHAAAAWFRDAVRLRRDDGDARANLEVVLRRIQALADRANQGKDGLEARLDRLIEDERALRDDIRGLLARLDAAGPGTEPLAFQDAFRAIAAWQRVLLGEAGAALALAGAEVDKLEAKPEAERTDEEKVRAIQLGWLAAHLERARQRMTDARATLHRLRAEAAHRRADAALADLKRAREQLRDPVAILRGCLGDELVIVEGAGALAAAGQAALLAAPEAVTRTPTWLTADWLAERQVDVRERTGEIAARLRAGVEKPAGGPPGGAAEKNAPSPVLEAAREALPHVERAAAAMREGEDAIRRERAAEMLGAAQRAAEELANAVERFADLRGLVEIAHAEQTALVAALEAGGEGDPAAAAARNRERVERMKAMIAAGVAAIDGPPPPDGAGSPAPPGPDDRKARERERYRLAEAERERAALALDRLIAALGTEQATAEAHEALERIEALRRLFFSIADHIEELLRREIETRDKTATAAAERAPEERRRLAGPLAAEEARQRAQAEVVATALAQGATAPEAGAAGPEEARKLEQAGAEVKAASEAMAAAAAALAAPAPDFDPALERQKHAIERLSTALALLRPPKDEGAGGEGPDSSSGGAGSEHGEEEARSISREEAQRRLQAVRDREAERRRSTDRTRGRIEPEPVEKDW